MEPGLDWRWHHLSDYALTSHSWAMRLAFVAIGAGSALVAGAFVVGLGRRAWPGAFLVLAWAAALGAMAAVPDGLGHAVLTWAAEAALVAGVALLLVAVRREPRWRGHAVFSVSIGSLALGAAALQAIPGLAQRVAVLAALAWLIVSLLRLDRR
jgi:hypothetical protein